jgi:hypothetical protein
MPRDGGPDVKDLIFRFIAGGLVVSGFAALGGVLKPKRFAGLFGAAPSIALATLGLTISVDGKLYAATEARSMIGGAISFGVYAYFCSWLMMRYRFRALAVTLPSLSMWLACSLLLWLASLR